VSFLKVVNDPANQPVFVHCWQGSDRTGMMVLSYRVSQQGWTVEDAIKELPNFGFHPVWKSIREYVANFNTARVLKKLAEAKAVRIETVE
jgi:protein tyrosine/serine phosphatase